MNDRYDFEAIEAKWQRLWEERKTFRAAGPGEPGFDPAKPKFYVLDMFPYPSGVGLHVGHPLGYIATDVLARYKRMRGCNVLHPMGFDAFGLPAEQFAVEHGVHPRVTTERNIANMRRQLRAFGLSYDWDRELATTDIGYYRWTQWIFLQLFNSWFDRAVQRARPIGELVDRLRAGSLLVGPEGELVPAGAPGRGRAWSELGEAERRSVVDGQRLAYLAEVPVNWCPALGTVLANEEVTNEGRSERGNHPVYRRPLRQWMLRITAYAERLAADLDLVDWPEPIKMMQRNWIGRSEGAMVEFRVQGTGAPIPVFTTRPDTLFGATYVVLAPEHPLVATLTTAAQAPAVREYQRLAEARTDVDRQAEAKLKSGVFTGARAMNPVNGAAVPIWIADYVLMGYGTGAIMAVPAHDQRDFEFAKQFALPIVAVVAPDDAWLLDAARAEGAAPAVRAAAETADAEAVARLRRLYEKDPGQFAGAFVGEGAGLQSANAEVSLDGVPTAQAKARITQWLAHKGLGQAKVQYKLRDWLFSRQRYWGEPFPILHGPDGSVGALDEAELPVGLPDMEDFTPRASDDPAAPPQPPLARAPEEWRVVWRDGARHVRELNTMPQWAGSCWYYLRYLDPHNSEQMVDPAKERYWMSPAGVDLYVGGAEHAVLHLLYARFWHKVLHDLGHVSTPEPFGRLFNQGYIQAYAYQDERGMYVPADEVEERAGGFYYRGQPVTRTFGKMGKSLKNAANPDDIFHEYGCDTLRLYEMYMGPLEASKPWNTRDIIGVHRFLQRVWHNFIAKHTGELLVEDAPAPPALVRLLHRTIKKVGEDMERLRFNTALAALIELNNEMVKLERIAREVAEPFLLMLAPLAPHLAEELWERLGHRDGIAGQPWPQWDERHLVEEQLEIVVQVMGKVRGRVQVPADAAETAVKEAALADPRVAAHLRGKTIRQVIYVPRKLVNVVVG